MTKEERHELSRAMAGCKLYLSPEDAESDDAINRWIEQMDLHFKGFGLSSDEGQTTLALTRIDGQLMNEIKRAKKESTWKGICDALRMRNDNFSDKENKIFRLMSMRDKDLNIENPFDRLAKIDRIFREKAATLRGMTMEQVIMSLYINVFSEEKVGVHIRSKEPTSLDEAMQANRAAHHILYNKAAFEEARQI
jgi:hypothetical protein